MISNSIHVPQWFGGGVGNELFPFAKARLAAATVGGSVYYPLQIDFVRKKSYFWKYSLSTYLKFVSWGRTVYYYTPSRYLKDVEETGSFDYSVNFERFYGELPKGRKIFVHGGMVGGFLGILRARPLIFEHLYSSCNSDSFLKEFITFKDVSKITVGIHIRRGDFSASNSLRKFKFSSQKLNPFSFGLIFRKMFGFHKIDVRSGGVQLGNSSECYSHWNTQVPISWFCEIISLLKQMLGNKIQFVVVSDGMSSAEQVKVTNAAGFTPIYFSKSSKAECDLCILSSCDLQICSTSTFSMWAPFLAETPYVFFRDHLSCGNEGFPYFWSKPFVSNCSQNQNSLPYGYAVSLNNIQIPSGLQLFLSGRIASLEEFLKSPVMGGYFAT